MRSTAGLGTPHPQDLWLVFGIGPSVESVRTVGCLCQESCFMCTLSCSGKRITTHRAWSSTAVTCPSHTKSRGGNFQGLFPQVGVCTGLCCQACGCGSRAGSLVPKPAFQTPASCVQRPCLHSHEFCSVTNSQELRWSGR